MKTLFDALKVPQNDSEVLPAQDKARAWCVCLLEDDSMISALNVIAIPTLRELGPSDVDVTMDVTIRAHDYVWADF